MEAAYVLLAVVFLLQIIILVKLNKVGATVAQLKERKSSRQDDRSAKGFNNKRGKDSIRKGNSTTSKRKSNKNTQNENTPSVSSVDKSLRDINLKLKNAEKDQEKARKKISEGNGPNKRNNHDSSKVKKNDDNGNSKKSNRNNDTRRSNRPNNNSSDNNKAEPKTDPVSTVKSEPTTPPPAKEEPVSVEKKSTPEFGRGKPATLKRRSLEDSDSATNETSSAQDNSSENNLENNSTQAISFGRR